MYKSDCKQSSSPLVPGSRGGGRQGRLEEPYSSTFFNFRNIDDSRGASVSKYSCRVRVCLKVIAPSSKRNSQSVPGSQKTELMTVLSQICHLISHFHASFGFRHNLRRFIMHNLSTEGF
jgi:hypothetical protein